MSGASPERVRGKSCPLLLPKPCPFSKIFLRTNSLPGPDSDRVERPRRRSRSDSQDDIVLKDDLFFYISSNNSSSTHRHYQQQEKVMAEKMITGIDGTKPKGQGGARPKEPTTSLPKVNYRPQEESKESKPTERKVTFSLSSENNSVHDHDHDHEEPRLNLVPTHLFPAPTTKHPTTRTKTNQLKLQPDNNAKEMEAEHICSPDTSLNLKSDSPGSSDDEDESMQRQLEDDRISTDLPRVSSGDSSMSLHEDSDTESDGVRSSPSAPTSEPFALGHIDVGEEPTPEPVELDSEPSSEIIDIHVPPNLPQQNEEKLPYPTPCTSKDTNDGFRGVETPLKYAGAGTPVQETGTPSPRGANDDDETPYKPVIVHGARDGHIGHSPGVVVDAGARGTGVYETVSEKEASNGQHALDEQLGRDRAHLMPRDMNAVLKLICQSKEITVPRVTSIVVIVKERQRIQQPQQAQPQQESDDLSSGSDSYNADIESLADEAAATPPSDQHTIDIYDYFLEEMRSESYIRGFINEIFRLMGMPQVEDVRKGCLEILLPMLNASQAQALLKAHASGKLKLALSKILLHGHEDEFELDVRIAEKELKRMVAQAKKGSSVWSTDTVDDDTVFLEKLEKMVSSLHRTRKDSEEDSEDPDPITRERKRRKAPRRKKPVNSMAVASEETSEDEVQQATRLFKSMPLLQLPDKDRRRQAKLSLWLQRQIESPEMNLPDVMASLKIHYQHSSNTSDEVVLIELKAVLSDLYQGRLEEAGRSMSNIATSLLPRTSNPSFLTIQLLLTRAELQRLDNQWGSLRHTLTDIRQLVSTQSPDEVTGLLCLNEARCLLHQRGMMQYNHDTIAIDEQIRHSLDTSMMYLNAGGNPSYLARCLLLRCKHHLQLSAIERSLDQTVISRDELERTWHCLQYFKSRIRPEDRTRRIDCYYLLVLSDYSHRTCEYHDALHHAEAALHVAQQHGFASQQAECRIRIDSLLQLISNMEQQQQVLGTLHHQQEQEEHEFSSSTFARAPADAGSSSDAATDSQYPSTSQVPRAELEQLPHQVADESEDRVDKKFKLIPKRVKDQKLQDVMQMNDEMEDLYVDIQEEMDIHVMPKGSESEQIRSEMIMQTDNVKAFKSEMPVKTKSMKAYGFEKVQSEQMHKERDDKEDKEESASDNDMTPENLLALETMHSIQQMVLEAEKHTISSHDSGVFFQRSTSYPVMVQSEQLHFEKDDKQDKEESASDDDMTPENPGDMSMESTDISGYSSQDNCPEQEPKRWQVGGEAISDLSQTSKDHNNVRECPDNNSKQVSMKSDAKSLRTIEDSFNNKYMKTFKRKKPRKIHRQNTVPMPSWETVKQSSDEESTGKVRRVSKTRKNSEPSISVNQDKMALRFRAVGDELSLPHVNIQNKRSDDYLNTRSMPPYMPPPQMSQHMSPHMYPYMYPHMPHTCHICITCFTHATHMYPHMPPHKGQNMSPCLSPPHLSSLWADKGRNARAITDQINEEQSQMNRVLHRQNTVPMITYPRWKSSNAQGSMKCTDNKELHCQHTMEHTSLEFNPSSPISIPKRRAQGDEEQSQINRVLHRQNTAPMITYPRWKSSNAQGSMKCTDNKELHCQHTMEHTSLKFNPSSPISIPKRKVQSDTFLPSKSMSPDERSRITSDWLIKDNKVFWQY